MTNEGLRVLSAQEQAIVDGKKVLHGTVTDRVLRMFDAIRSYGPPCVALERAIYFTESFKTTEGRLLVLRWAKSPEEHCGKDFGRHLRSSVAPTPGSGGTRWSIPSLTVRL